MRFTIPGILLCVAGIALGREEPRSGTAPFREASREEREAAYRNHVLKVLDGVRYREGIQELPGGIANLHLPEGFRYLDPEDSRRVVVDLWGNPPGGATDVLGMILPAGEHLAVSNSWAIVISHGETGHVSDEDADMVDYDGLLEQLKIDSRRSSEARKAAGFETMELTGWAVEPRYDPQQKVLYWAKRFKISAHAEETLNYDVRVLGRQGVLSLNAVAGMNRVADIEAATPDIVSMLRFNRGFRYSDYDPATDKKADFTLAGLVLGGAVAGTGVAEAGLFANYGKLSILGGVGLLLLVRRMRGAGRPAA